MSAGKITAGKLAAAAACLLLLGAPGWAGREAAEAKVPKASRQTGGAERELIPAGEFRMGSPAGEGSPDEHPPHKVYLDAYYIDRYEVSVGRYKDFSRSTGREMRAQPGWSTDRHPVVIVDWEDAAAYCKWAGGRLPTEAEWEKAARGGTDTRYSFGDDAGKLGEYAWYDDNSDGRAHPVGRKKPNRYGLYDMQGNVWEWVSDWYDENYYALSPKSDPKGPAEGLNRGLRGGSWFNKGGFLRAAYRDGNSPVNWNNLFGFRCAAPAQASKRPRF